MMYLFIIAFTALIRLGNAMQFDMLGQHKCIYEEMNSNVIVVGDWTSFHKDNEQSHLQVHLKVHDPHGSVLHESNGWTSSGQFVFTTKTAGEYKACYYVQDAHNSMQTRIKLDLKTGVAATDWNSIAKKEHLDTLTVELRRLEDTIREVYNEMLQLQNREQEMREISESTNARVAWYSVATLFVCMLSGIWQLWYLRRFFQRKKLL